MRQKKKWAKKKKQKKETQISRYGKPFFLIATLLEVTKQQKSI